MGEGGWVSKLSADTGLSIAMLKNTIPLPPILPAIGPDCGVAFFH